MFLNLKKTGKHKGKFFIHYVNPITKKWIKTTDAEWNTDKEKAEKLLASMKREAIHSNNFKEDNSKAPKLSTFVDKILAYVKDNRNQNTYTIYKKVLTYFLEETTDIPLKDVDSKHVESYKQKRKKVIQPATVNIELRTLKAAFNLVVGDKKVPYLNSELRITENPVKGIEQEKVFENDILSIEDNHLVKITSIMNESYRDLCLFALYTGTRLNEILWLRWKRSTKKKDKNEHPGPYIDLDNNMIYIRNRVESKINENGRKSYVVLFKTKTGESRDIPIDNPKLLQLVHKLFNNKVSNKIFYLDDYVFCNDKGMRYNLNYISRTFKLYVRKAMVAFPEAEIPEYYHFHCLRHTNITNLLKDNISIYKVKKLAGHSRMETTDRYAHLVGNDLREDMKKVSWAV